MAPPLEPECASLCALTEASDELAPALVVKPQVHAAASVSPAFERLYSREGSARETGTLRSLAGRYAGKDDVVVLSGGFPARDLFPFTSLSATCSDGTRIDLSGAALTAAQQYNVSLRGQPPLLAWATEHMAALHQPPVSAGHEVLITNGGNHSLEMVLSLFLDPGDALLVEEYSYPVVVESIAAPKGYMPVGVPMDSQGIVHEALEELLARLAAQHAADPGGRPFPKLLYTIPNGQNPTGATVPLARKRAVYAACRRHGLVIVEDDPYCYLRYGAAALTAAEDPGPEAMPGLAGAAAEGSYLGLDADGRVIRVDSFAKFLAPGLRLGWVTAAPPVIHKLTCTIQAHTVGPCSLSQALVSATLAAWGDRGLDTHLRRVQAEYARRARLMLAAADRELSGLAQWAPPAAGMFLWVRLLGEEDSDEVWRELSEAGVIVIPGKPLHWRGQHPSFRSPYMRLSFSQTSDEAIAEGLRRMGAVLRRRASQRAGEANGISSSATSSSMSE